MCVGLEDLRLKLEVEHKVVGPTVRGHYFLHIRDGAGSDFKQPGFEKFILKGRGLNS